MAKNLTAVQGLSLFRHTTCTPCYLASVEPSVSVFVQGRNESTSEGSNTCVTNSSFLVASIDAPVQSQIIEASQAAPELAMRLRLDMQMVREMVSREDLPEPIGRTERRGLAVGHTTVGLVSAAARLIDLLDTPRGYSVPWTPY